MGRTVVAEETVRRYLDGLVSKNEVALGLILGQSTEQRDYVVHMVRTPLQVEEEKKGQTKGKTVKKLKENTLDQWDSYLVAQHAKQVTRMLLGGFDVLGIFVCLISDSLPNSALSLLRKTLLEIHNTLIKCQYYMKTEGTEMLLLHVSCAPHKVICKTIDVSSTLASPKPADFKFQSVSKWFCFHCQLAIDQFIPLPKDVTNISLIQQIKKGLDPFCKEIINAVALVNGSLNGEATLDKVDNGGKGKKGKHKGAAVVSQQSYQVDLLKDLNCDNGRNGQILIEECGSIMHVKGTIKSRTYIPNKPTMSEGIQCLKLDILRSLISRCDVHCEDLLVIDEEQQDRVVVHELPCRIFAPLPNLEVTISDYIFPGETAADSLDAFLELLDISCSVDDIETNCERLPESADLKSPLENEEGDTGVPVAELLPPKAPKSLNYIFLGVSLAVAFIAGGISYYFLLN